MIAAFNGTMISTFVALATVGALRVIFNKNTGARATALLLFVIYTLMTIAAIKFL